MDNRREVREFLVSRRAKVTPQQAGLSAGPNRRVPGLRRTEVAALAGVSVEYYAKLERGAIGGAFSSVLDAIARALQLDDTERAHLFDLARAADGIPASGRRRRRSAKQPGARPSLQWTLEAITDGVAFVRDQHQDLLATSALGRAFFSPLIGDGGRTLADPEWPQAQLSLMTHDATAPVIADASIQVDDVDACHEAALRAGAEIVHPLTDEPWGVRRFFVRDPDGHVLNVLSHS